MLNDQMKEAPTVDTERAGDDTLASGHGGKARHIFS